jgi:3-deoxy-manno-octulosonate cytidylyltransferase (CMP-KDO synthetase)
MIEHVYRRTKLSQSVSEVYIATCDDEIMKAAEEFGAPAILTSSTHERASDRVAEVAQSVEADLFVMVQGDEPMIVPEMIDLSVAPFEDDPDVVCVNLAARIESEVELEDPNTIKVAISRHGDALYFSREAVPSRTQLPFSQLATFKQVCVIPFRREFLLKYTSLTPTPLEEAEAIDMLRALEHGYRVRLVESPFVTYAVDTIEDLDRVQEVMRHDPLYLSYADGR